MKTNRAVIEDEITQAEDDLRRAEDNLVVMKENYRRDRTKYREGRERCEDDVDEAKKNLENLREALAKEIEEQSSVAQVARRQQRRDTAVQVREACIALAEIFSKVEKSFDGPIGKTSAAARALHSCRTSGTSYSKLSHLDLDSRMALNEVMHATPGVLPYAISQLLYRIATSFGVRLDEYVEFNSSLIPNRIGYSSVSLGDAVEHYADRVLSAISSAEQQHAVIDKIIEGDN